MKLLMENGTLFKKIIDSVKDLVAEASIDIDENCLSMTAMDSSHVCVCSLHLNKDGFTEYSCETPTNIGISMTNLSKLLKCAQNTDSVCLEIKENKPDKLNVEFKSEKKLTKTEMNLMVIDQDGLEIPETDYGCKVVIKATEFQKIMKDISPLGDTCEITVTEDYITFSVTGDIGKIDVQLNTVEKECEINIEKHIKTKFAIKYLSDFSKATSLSQNVILNMDVTDEGDEQPVIVHYDMGENVGFIKYFLAPKIEEE